METIDAIILAGGLGTRLRDVVSDLPKVLAPVNGRPFLDILLGHLHRSGGIRTVVLAVGYLADKVIKHYRNGATRFHFPVLFSVEATPLGTGGAIRKALGLTETETILVMNGDSYVDVDLEAMAAAHKAKRAAVTIVVKNVPDASRYGTVLMGGDGRLIAFEEKKEKSSGGYINAGVYLLGRELVTEVEEDAVISWERDMLPRFLDKPVYGFVSQGKFIDIGIPETYRAAGEYFKE